MALGEVGVRPKSAKVTFVYVCPSCGWQIEATPREVKLLGGSICVCEKYVKFEPIVDVKISPIYKGDKPKVPKQPQMKTVEVRPVQTQQTPPNDSGGFIDKNFIEKESIAALMRTGFDKGTAKASVKSLMAQKVYTCSEDVIKDIFSPKEIKKNAQTTQ